MTTIDTSTTATATAYSNQRKVIRTETNGVLWTAFWNGASSTTAAIEFWYSTDNGATFTHGASDFGFAGTGTTYTPNFSMHADLDDYLHVVYKDRHDGYIYYRRGTPNAGRTAWTWSAAQLHRVEAADNYPDVVAHREGSGWTVHMVYSYVSGSSNWTQYRRWNIDSGGTITKVEPEQVLGGSYANANHTWPSIDFNHTGDGKTVAGSTPHLYAAWSAGDTGSGKGIRFRKATYSAGAWTWGTEREIDSTRYVGTGVSRWMNCLFDGTRAIITGYLDSAGSDLMVYDRDAADTTTTIHLVEVGNAANKHTLEGSSTYDSSGNVWFVGRDNDGSVNQLDYSKWTRATDTFEGHTTIDTLVGTTVYASAKCGYSNNRIEFIYTDGTASPYNVTYDSISLNTAPTAATWDLTDNQAHDVNATLTLPWTFNDPDPGDTQGSYAMRRQIGAAAYAYWNAGTSTWGASEVQNTSSTTQLALASGWGADIDANHKYAVKTWDLAGLEGVYSSELTVIPSAKVNPAITVPADAGTVVTSSITAEWTVAQQSQYKVRLLSAASAELWTSGWVTSTSARSRTIGYTLENLTSYKVEVTTKNTEGLASDADTHSFSTSFTPPATPTLVITGSAANAYITVAITNPGTGATEESNDVFVRVAAGGRADIDRPVGGDGLRIATGVAVNGSYIDRAAAGNTDYQFKARAHATNGTHADSAWT